MCVCVCVDACVHTQIHVHTQIRTCTHTHTYEDDHKLVPSNVDTHSIQGDNASIDPLMLLMDESSHFTQQMNGEAVML